MRHDYRNNVIVRIKKGRRRDPELNNTTVLVPGSPRVGCGAVSLVGCTALWMLSRRSDVNAQPSWPLYNWDQGTRNLLE